MKIVFLTRLFSPHIGGVEKHVYELSKILIDRGHEVTVITEQFEDSLSLRETIQKISVLRIPVAPVSDKQKKFVVWKWINNNSNILNSADVIHIHDVVYWLYFYKLTHLTKNIFTTFHGWEGIYPIPLKNIWQKKFDAFISSKKICIGEFICKWYGIKADIISYGAVHPPKTKFSKSKNILLFLGRLEKDTGFTQCLNMYSSIPEKNKPELHIAGDGPLRNLVPDHAVYHGQVKEVSDLISNSRYIFTTGYLGILESFIHHKPVIVAANNPVKIDYLRLHPQSTSFIWKLPLTDKLPDSAYNWAISQTWDKLADQYVSLWPKYQ